MNFDKLFKYGLYGKAHNNLFKNLKTFYNNPS